MTLKKVSEPADVELMASSKSTKEDRVVVRHVGSMIAQSAIIEIKTRAAHKELDMEAIRYRY